MIRMPDQVMLQDGRVATFDHATNYTEDPLPGEERPPDGQVFAYYVVNDNVSRVPLNMKGMKFSPGTVEANIVSILNKL